MQRFTEAQVQAMPDFEIDDRVGVRVGWHNNYTSAMSPLPWYYVPYSLPARRSVQEDIGDPPRPYPVRICGGGMQEGVLLADLALASVGISIPLNETPRRKGELVLLADDAAED